MLYHTTKNFTIPHAKLIKMVVITATLPVKETHWPVAVWSELGRRCRPELEGLLPRPGPLLPHILVEYFLRWHHGGKGVEVSESAGMDQGADGGVAR